MDAAEYQRLTSTEEGIQFSLYLAIRLMGIDTELFERLGYAFQNTNASLRRDFIEHRKRGVDFKGDELTRACQAFRRAPNRVVTVAEDIRKYSFDVNQGFLETSADKSTRDLSGARNKFLDDWLASHSSVDADLRHIGALKRRFRGTVNRFVEDLAQAAKLSVQAPKAVYQTQGRQI